MRRVLAGCSYEDRECDPMGMPSRVLAVILNWNGRDLTRQCVDHLRRQDYPSLQVLVVDNASTDGSVDDSLRDALLDDEILLLSENRGFAGGMNAGLKRASSLGFEYAWLLNNDAFPEPNCLSALMRVVEEDELVAMVTPRLVGIDGLDQHIGGILGPDGFTNDYVYSNVSMPADAWVTGTALLVRLSCLDEVGLFDERFFAYWEDVDLRIRCIRAGWKLTCEPSARCLHLGGSSSGGLDSAFCYHIGLRNTSLFLRKHLPWRCRPAALLRLSAEAVDQAAQERFLGRPALASALVGGLTAIIAGKVGRPSRLTAHPWVERFVLDHWWGISRFARMLSDYFPTSRSKFVSHSRDRVSNTLVADETQSF